MRQNKVFVLDEYHNGNITAVPYGSDIRTAEQRKAQQKHRERKNLRKADERGSFVILNLDYVHKKLTEVTYLEMGYAMMLLPYVTF